MFNKLSALLDWLNASIAAEIPADVSACEFDCRKLQCSEEEWENCPKRLRQARVLQKATVLTK